MKRRLAAILLAAMLCGTLTGCGADAGHVSSVSRVSGKEPDEAFCASQTAFALRLMQETVKNDEGSNLLISPYSVMQALGMTANGAAGNTRTEMETALGGIPAEQLNAYLKYQRETMPAHRSSKIKNANSLWLRDQGSNIHFLDSFLNLTRNCYDAKIKASPMDQSTVREINRWCCNQTDNMIPEMISGEIPATSVMLLVNAVCFNGKWAEKYEDDPEPGVFTAYNGRKQLAQMMFSEDNQYLKCSGASGFLKPYKGGDYVFAAILPNANRTPAEWLSGLEPKELRTMLTQAEPCDLYVGMPEFSYDYNTELTPVLQTLGMRDAFSKEQADFSGIAETSEENKLYISGVKHKTHIEVDTKGTRAAAVVEVDMAMYVSVTEPFILNRPFVYMIVETQTMIPVFIGILNEIPDA